MEWLVLFSRWTIAPVEGENANSNAPQSKTDERLDIYNEQVGGKM